MRKALNKLVNTKTETYIFFTTLSVYIFLWLTNINNKFIAVFLFAIIFIYNLKLKNFRFSAFLAYISSSIVFTGKTYPHQIVPSGVLPIEIYPFGFFINITITPNIILACLLLFLILKDVFNRRAINFKLSFIDILMILFWVWPIYSDLLASKDPEFSLIFSAIGSLLLVVYFYVKIYFFNTENFFKYLVTLLSSLSVFEFLVSCQQFLAKSPIFKNLEYQVNIEYFGAAADEIAFAFRPLGTFVHANALGIWISSISVLLFIVFLSKPTTLKFYSFLVSFGTLILTLSRSSWLGFIVALLICLVIIEKIKNTKIPKKSFNYLKIFWVSGLVLGIFFILPRLEKSTYTFSNGGGYFREVQFQRALETISANPVFGVGSARSVQEGLNSLNKNDLNTSIVQNVHNWYILAAIEHGIPYVLLFVLIVFIYIKKYINKLHLTALPLGNINAIIQMSLFSCVVGSLVSAIFQPFLNLQIVVIAIAIFSISNAKNWDF